MRKTKPSTKRVAKHPVLGVAPSDLYNARYRVRIQLRDRITGGVPKHPDIHALWLETKGMPPADALEMTEKLRAENEDQFIEKELVKGWNGFRSDKHGLYIESRNFEAMLKEAATETGLTQQKRGFRQRLQHGCFVKPPRIHIQRKNGAGFTTIKEPDGDEVRVAHVQTPKGKQATIKRYDYVNAAVLDFEIWLVQAQITDGDLRKMLYLNEEQGIGANRSAGEGKFDVLAFEKLA